MSPDPVGFLRHMAARLAAGVLISDPDRRVFHFQLSGRDLAPFDCGWAAVVTVRRVDEVIDPLSGETEAGTLTYGTDGQP